MSKIKQFFVDARAEFRHVNWPHRAEAARLTAVVLGLSLLIAIFLGGFDYAFTWGLQNLIIR